jgi:hypothetical protein
MTLLRTDYVTKSGDRGIWDDEQDHTGLEELKEQLPHTLHYARSKMPEIKKLVIVEISERDVHEETL